MADEQNMFRRRFQFIQLPNQRLRIAVRHQCIRKCKVFFQFQRLGDDFGGLARAQKRAGKNQIETQVHVFHGAGNLPELAPAFGGQRPVGIHFEPRRATLHRNSMPQNIKIHNDSISVRVPGATPPNVTFFHLGFNEVAT